MKKLNKTYLQTGATRIFFATSLTATLLGVTPTIVYADVKPADIIGDLQVEDDRTDIKSSEVTGLKGRYGGGYITLDEVEKAIKLSNLLNSYFYEPLEYTNTTPSELLTIDIITMYNNYETFELAGNIDAFCADNLCNKPACDGFITLSSKTVSNEIKNSLINIVINLYQTKGKTITGTPVLSINGNELSVTLEVNGKIKKAVITGDNIKTIIKKIKGMNKIYTKAIKNISGKSIENDGSFLYNGINIITNESVYLSLPDDNKKAKITSGINIARNITNSEKYQIARSMKNGSLTETEKQTLREMGYSEEQIATATIDILSLTKINAKKLTK